MTETEPVDIATDGPAAPPRANGEIVFEAPWEARAFGIAVSLCEEGHYEWPVFQAALIERVAAAEATDAPFDYWRCWLRALDYVVESTDLVAPAEIERTAEELAAREPGHDHHR